MIGVTKSVFYLILLDLMGASLQINLDLTERLDNSADERALSLRARQHEGHVRTESAAY
jgi:hypothetical protein